MTLKHYRFCIITIEKLKIPSQTYVGLHTFPILHCHLTCDFLLAIHDCPWTAGFYRSETSLVLVGAAS